MRRFPRATSATGVLATCLLLSTPVGPAAAALEAAPAATTVVTYGDSYTANPSQVVGMANQYEELKPFLTDYPRTGQLESGKECLQAPDNWPRLLQDRGVDVRDWSCTAQTSRTMLDRIDASIAAGDLTADTDTVIFPVGLNNFGPWGQKDGVDVTDFAAVQDAYRADMREAARRVRAVAPEVSLVVSGMPQIGDGDRYCIVNVVPDRPAGVSVPYLAKAEDAVQTMQRQSADDIGAEFVDLKTASRGHDSCAPDTERYVAGLVDTTTPDYKMIIHPSQAGQRFIAEQLASVV
jgi:hypothetical protein